jgi:cytochrome c-type biogenesis protein CcmH/NrfG
MTESDRALAPLNAVSAAIDRLETYRNPQELAESLQAIGQAVERSLRQLLRADTSAPDELRLAALSSDDLPMDRLIAALRKNNLLSLQLGGMIHELHQATSRAAAGDVRASDADNARDTVHRMKDEIAARGDAPMREVATNAVTRGDIEEEPWAVRTSGSSRSLRAILPIAILAALALIAWLAFRILFSPPSPMDTGIAAFGDQRWGVAEQNFKAELAKHPDNVTARLYLGRVLRVQGRTKDAAVVLNQARKDAPKDADVLRELGHTFMDLKQPASAVAAYRQAQELDPANDANWVGLVRALRAAGDPSAEDVLARAPAKAQETLRSKP